MAQPTTFTLDEIAALVGIEGERVALCDVSINTVLQDLLAEVTIGQNDLSRGGTRWRKFNPKHRRC